MVRNPEEVLEQTYSMAAGKYVKTWYQIFWLGIMAGAYIAIGGFLSLLVGEGFPEMAEANPGLAKLLSEAMFPVGLILVVLTGAELFTSNNAVLIPAAIKSRIPRLFPLKLWMVVYVANFIGKILISIMLIFLHIVYNFINLILNMLFLIFLTHRDLFKLCAVDRKSVV